MAQRSSPDFDRLRARARKSPSRRTSRDLPAGFNRFGTPTTCGIILPNGKECREPASGGPCDYHFRLRQAQAGDGGEDVS